MGVRLLVLYWRQFARHMAAFPRYSWRICLYHDTLQTYNNELSTDSYETNVTLVMKEMKHSQKKKPLQHHIRVTSFLTKLAWNSFGYELTIGWRAF